MYFLIINLPTHNVLNCISKFLITTIVKLVILKQSEMKWHFYDYCVSFLLKFYIELLLNSSYFMFIVLTVDITDMFLFKVFRFWY